MKRVIVGMLFVAPLLVVAQVPESNKAPVSNASVEELVDSLKPRPRTRSMGRNLAVEPARIDLSINFEFNSATLRADSIPLLERLAAAMSTEQLIRSTFQVEGHTDSVGNPRYNDALSMKRAQAVVDLLIQNKVEPSRLQSIGKGSSEPLLPDEPTAAANRRVRISAIETR